MLRRANDVRPTDPVRYGAYLCLAAPPDGGTELVDRLGLRNEFDPGNDGPPLSIAYLRRVAATPGDVADDALWSAQAVIHVAAPTPEPVKEFCAQIGPVLAVLAGVVRPTRFTGTEMHNFAYAQRVVQQPGTVMPSAFLMPMCKSAAWWEKCWMEQHTYMLPRYDESGRMLHEGHVLASAIGMPSLMRRLYRNQAEPAPAGEYDFLTYFECADSDVPLFQETCAALRDVRRNPEWAFVQEGPTWHGRRVATWPELFN